MEKLVGDLEELLCRLDASYRRPISVDSLLYLMPQLVCQSVLELNLEYEELWDFMKRFPTLFALDDASKRVCALSTSRLAYNFLQYVFTLARRRMLSAQYIKSECCVRGDWLWEALQWCLDEFNDVFELHESNAIKVAGPDFEAGQYSKVTLSRFFELLLLKLSCSGVTVSHWPLAVLQTYLLECPVRKQVVDLQELFEQYKDIYEVVLLDSGPAVALKRLGRPEWNVVLVACIRAYLFSRRAFSEASAVPLSKLVSEAVPNASPRTLPADGKKLVEAALKVHTNLFAGDRAVHLASRISSDTVEKMVEASVYFHRILHALALCGHGPICYNILLTCVEVAPDSVRRFLCLEFPNLALIDFFRFMPEFFYASLPNCVRPVLTKPIECLDGSRSEPAELEAMTVQRFVTLLWVVSRGLRIEVLNLCLNYICPEVKRYCLERYKKGLMEFFKGHPSIFRILSKEKTVELALETPKFSANFRCATSSAVPVAHLKLREDFYERVAAVVGMIDKKKSASQDANFLTAFTCFPGCFVLQDDKVVLSADDQESSMVRASRRLLCHGDVRNQGEAKERLMELPSEEDGGLQCNGTALVDATCRSNSGQMQKVKASKKGRSTVRRGKSGTRCADKTSGDKSFHNHAPVPSQSYLDDVGDPADDFDLDWPYRDAVHLDCDTQLTAEEASVRYFLELLSSSSGSMSVAEMEAALGRAPHAVQAFCRKNFQRGLVTFFKACSSDFKVTMDGRVQPVTHRLLTGNEGDSGSTSPEDSTNFSRLLKVQLLAARTNEYVAGVLKATETRRCVEVLREILRAKNPMLLGYCDDHYRLGLQGFLKCNPHVYDISGTGKTFVLQMQGALNYGSCLGKIAQRTALDGLIASERFCRPVFFPAWAFVDPKRLASITLNSDLKVGDSVEFCFLLGRPDSPCICCVTKVENPGACKTVKVPCDCAVIFAGPYYALLEPKFFRGNVLDHPPRGITIVYSHQSGLNKLALGARVVATVQPSYPSSLLWKAHQLLTRSGESYPTVSPETTCHGSGVSETKEVQPDSTAAQENKGDVRRMAVGYYVTAIRRLGHEASLNDLELAVQKSPDIVKAYLRENFSGDTMAFFRSHARRFEELENGKIRLAFGDRASSSRPPVGQKEMDSVVENPKAVSRKSKGSGSQDVPRSDTTARSHVARAGHRRGAGTTRAAETGSRKERRARREKDEVISDIGTISELLEREAAIASDSLPHTLRVPSQCFVVEDGSVSSTLDSTWQVGQAVVFTAIRSSTEGKLRATCVLRLKTWVGEDSIVPEARQCEVILVRKGFVLLNVPSETDVKAVACSPDAAPLRVSQKVVVEVLPHYPSSSLWKAVKVVKLLSNACGERGS